jgi:hypothetical protein
MSVVKLTLGDVQMSGPLFDRPGRALAQGGAALIADYAGVGVEIMRNQMEALGVRRTGQAINSVTARHVRRSEAVAGYAVILPTAVWGGVLSVRRAGTETYVNRRGQTRTRTVWERRVLRSDSSRPTRAWLAYGMRGGRKLGKQRNFFGRTSTELRRRYAAAQAVAQLVKALND